MNRYNAQKALQSSFRLFSQTTKPIQLPLANINNIIAINSQVQNHKRNLITSNETNNECWILMRELRKDDVFPTELNKEEMIKLLFPKTSPELVLSLSNVTAVFYGNMLQTCGNVIGMDNIDKVSNDFFYTLGKTIAKITTNATENQYDVPKDARGVAVVLITAIYKASPEYKFQVIHFDKDHCEIELKGADRYLRITKALGFSDKLGWPVLHRFMEGIRDELKADVDVKSEMLSAEDSGECHERFTMRKRLR